MKLKKAGLAVPPLKTAPKSAAMNPPHAEFSSSTPVADSFMQEDFFCHKNFLGHNINYKARPSPIFALPANKPSSYNQTPKGGLTFDKSLFRKVLILTLDTYWYTHHLLHYFSIFSPLYYYCTEPKSEIACRLATK